MKIYKIFSILALLNAVVLNAQQLVPSNKGEKKDVIEIPNVPKEQMKTDEYGTYYYDERQKAKIYDINGEILIALDNLEIAAKPHFNNQLDRNYYFFLNKHLNRVYPLFLVALEQYREVHAEAENMKKSEKRDFIRKRQQQLAAVYEQQLRDLTTTEGKIFAKLMNRATGKTVYEIIKELRGGWSAFWWNIKGNMADIELKKTYNPHINRTDNFLESLLLSNWNYGYLEPYEGSSEFQTK